MKVRCFAKTAENRSAGMDMIAVSRRALQEITQPNGKSYMKATFINALTAER